MSERKSGMSKGFALKMIEKYLALVQQDLHTIQEEYCSEKITLYNFLAETSGATDYEICEAYFSRWDSNDRQNLMGAFCENFWHDKDFTSLEELHSWVEKMVKIRNRFHLQDPLAESAQKPETRVEDLKLSDAFKKDRDRQGLFDLYALKVKEDVSFPTLDELKKWTTEMLNIKLRYQLKDPLEQQEKAVNAKKFTRPWFRPGLN